MYITYQNQQFTLTQEKTGTLICTICPPILLESGEEYIMVSVDGETNCYTGGGCRAVITPEKVSDTLFSFRREMINETDRRLEFQTVFRIVAEFPAERYLIPCVNINGNPFGSGNEPKGLTKDGKKWIFAYDRESIPSLTLTENQEFALGLFASDETEESLASSCSISQLEDGRFVQELYHPVIESPVRYAFRDAYAPVYETFLTLEPGERFVSRIYLSVSRPRWANFGIADVMDSALELFGDNQELEPFLPGDGELWDNSIAFAKSLLGDYKGKPGFNIGFLPDGEGGFQFRGDQCFELAWCGQNVLLSRMLIEDFARTGNRDSLETALAVLDIRVESCTAKSGLLAAQLRDAEQLEEATADTCNMGYGAYEFICCYLSLQRLGIDRPAYLAAARGLCDFFCDHFDGQTGFCKLWRLDGTLLDGGGSIGAFVILPMAKLYEVTGEEKYLLMAEKAMDFYMARDLDQFSCTAGALDTCCVDKETSAPFLMSGVLLYQLTGQEKYLTGAKKAAYYFASWMFHYQPIYAPDSEISRYHISVRGLTSVSAQHHHLDMYAGILVPSYWELAKLSGDHRWKTYGDMMWRSVRQYIGDGELTVHGVRRPIGSQNEALFHCNWVFQGGKRGMLNDWLVAWPCGFRLSVLASGDFTKPQRQNNSNTKTTEQQR